MALYFIGDLQGCHAPLQRLLHAIDFSPSRDTIYLLGDLVNRGADSLSVLKTLAGLGNAAQCLLGNHDLHLLTVGYGLRPAHRSDTLQGILDAPDCPTWLDWLRHQRMALTAQGWLMVHAGVLPQWTAGHTLELAREVEQALQAPDPRPFLAGMYGNSPARWQEDLQGPDRLRVIVNALTRLRFCKADGEMEFASKGEALSPPAGGYLPWFEVPGRASVGVPIAFGHWSTLGLGAAEHTPVMRNNTLALDTGCVWGQCLTAARLGAASGAFELISVDCAEEARSLIKPS